MESNYRNSYFSDADLVNECNRIITCVKRDLSDFAVHKITPSFLDNFSAIALCLSDLRTDEEWEDSIVAATENKDGILELIQRKMVKVRMLAEALWAGTGKYKAFGFEDLDTFADSEVLLVVKRVVRVSNRYLSELQANGLPADIVTELKELGQQYLDAIHLLRDTINAMASQMEERSGLASHLYDILKMLANIGKGLYQNNNEGKYNNYILQIEKSVPASLSQSA